MTYMIYGANGYTGELIAREAVRRGQKPVLAGRSAEKVEALARELGLESRVFDLDAPRIDGVAAVLHCAGPFSRTSAPMVRACLEKGVHYLDITGEIDVFEAVLGQHDEAVRRGVTLLPGVGFDVVPTDCLAAMLAAKLPDANELWLAFFGKGMGISPGTAKTMYDTAHRGGAIRKDGKIVRVPMVFDVREIPFSCGPKTAMTIPWGDVSTAYHTTGIPNIRVYSARPRKSIDQLRRIAPLLKLMSFPPLKKLMQRMAGKRPGPSDERRAAGRTYLWGRVANPSGREVTMTMETPEGYTLTVFSALAAVERLLEGPKRPGAYTPAKFFGADFVTSLPGVTLP